nr:MAG TPA: hypothetical protein [Caudoviricetes sp.]
MVQDFLTDTHYIMTNVDSQHKKIRAPLRMPLKSVILMLG